MFVPIGTEQAVARRRFPVVTAALITINVIVFLIEAALLLTGGEEALNLFVLRFGVVPAHVTGAQEGAIPAVLTLFTSMFVHGSLLHIGFNMAYLYAFGDNVEDRLGYVRYVIFYLLAGLLGSAAHIASAPASVIPSVGASGAIAGVLAGYIVFFPKGTVRMFLFFGPLSRITRIPALLFIGFWFFTQFLSGISSLGVATAETAGVAYWAHIGGFAGGLLLAFLYRQLLDKPATQVHDR